MTTPEERMPRVTATSNAESVCATSDKRLGKRLSEVADPDRRVPSVGDSADLTNRCPTCLVETVHRRDHPSRVVLFANDVPVGDGRGPTPVTTAEALRERCGNQEAKGVHAGGSHR